VTVALSTCEAEYMAICAGTQEGKYLVQLCNEFLNHKLSSFLLYNDNQGSIALAKNPGIDIKYHFIRFCISSGNLILLYIPTANNIADIFTKPVSKQKFIDFQKYIFGG
jgi:hypothetical protein